MRVLEEVKRFLRADLLSNWLASSIKSGWAGVVNICSDPVLFISGVRHSPDEAKCRRGGEFLVSEVAGPCRELELVDLGLLHILEHQRKLLWVWLDREPIGFGSSFKIIPAAKPTDPSS